jgi:hypothetical protein
LLWMRVPTLRLADARTSGWPEGFGVAAILVSCALLSGVTAHAASDELVISRSHISAPTKRDPYVTRGTYRLRLRGHDLVASWHGTVKRTTRLLFAIYPARRNGGNPPGFHSEAPHQSLAKTAHRGRDQTVTVVFHHPRVVRDWPCVGGGINDEPPGLNRVYVLGPFVPRLVCPRGGFRLTQRGHAVEALCALSKVRDVLRRRRVDQSPTGTRDTSSRTIANRAKPTSSFTAIQSPCFSPIRTAWPTAAAARTAATIPSASMS